MNTLQSVAAGCWHGASNPLGLLKALSEAMRLRLGPLSPADQLDLRIIVDHLDDILPPLSEASMRYDPTERYDPKQLAA